MCWSQLCLNFIASINCISSFWMCFEVLYYLYWTRRSIQLPKGKWSSEIPVLTQIHVMLMKAWDECEKWLFQMGWVAASPFVFLVLYRCMSCWETWQSWQTEMSHYVECKTEVGCAKSSGMALKYGQQFFWNCTWVSSRGTGCLAYKQSRTCTAASLQELECSHQHQLNQFEGKRLFIWSLPQDKKVGWQLVLMFFPPWYLLINGIRQVSGPCTVKTLQEDTFD